MSGVQVPHCPPKILPRSRAYSILLIAVSQLLKTETIGLKWLFVSGSPETGLRRCGGLRGPQRQVFVAGVEGEATFEMSISCTNWEAALESQITVGDFIFSIHKIRNNLVRKRLKPITQRIAQVRWAFSIEYRHRHRNSPAWVLASLSSGAIRLLA